MQELGYLPAIIRFFPTINPEESENYTKIWVGDDMDGNTEIALIRTLYDRIRDILIRKGDNSAFDAKSVFVQSVPIPGVTIDIEDYKNATSPSNPRGNLLSSEMFSTLVDMVPRVDANYLNTAYRVETTYGDIVKYAQASDPVVLKMLSENQKEYNESELSHQIVGGGSWHLTYSLPSNWCTLDPTEIYFEFPLSTKKPHFRDDSEFVKYGGEVPYKKGLWSIGGSFEDDIRGEQHHVEATYLEISTEICPVEIVRPWMNANVLSMTGWNMGAAFKKGALSSGRLSQDENCGTMPLIPVFFVASRNVRIWGDWSDAEKKLIDSAISGDEDVSLGPFQLSGRYYRSSSRFKSSYEDGRITIPGMHIIAWASQIVPPCPPG